MIRRIFAGFLLSLFILLSIPVTFAFGLFKTFLDPYFYDDSFVNVFYDFTLEELPAFINLNKEIQGVSDEDIRALIKEVFLKEDLRSVIDSVVEQVSTVEVSADGTAVVVIPLDWLVDKQDIVIDKIVDHLSETLSVCNTGVLTTSEGDLCVPQGVNREDFARSLRHTFDIDIASQLPNDSGITLNNLPEFLRGHSLSNYVGTLIARVFTVGALVLLLILLLIGSIIFHPWVRIMKWEAKTVFLSTFAISLFLFLIFIVPIKTAPDYLLVYARLYAFLIGSVIGKLVFYLAPIMIISLILWIVGIIYDKDK